MGLDAGSAMRERGRLCCNRRAISDMRWVDGEKRIGLVAILSLSPFR